jgi:hypothetical protein
LTAGNNFAASANRPAEIRSRNAQLAKLRRGDRRDFVFLDGDITGIGGHDQHSHGAFSLGFVARGKRPPGTLL